MAAWPIYLGKIVRHEPTHMGFCDASGLGSGGVCLDPAKSGHNLVWHPPCPPDIIADLVSSINQEGKITNYNLELAAIVLHEANIQAELPTVFMTVPRSGSDNTPTVLWSMHEALTIDPVVADILRIRALHSRFFLKLFQFLSPGARKLHGGLCLLSFPIF